MASKQLKPAFVSSGSPVAESAISELSSQYGNASIEECDVIVVLGGDGFVLHCLHKYLDSGKPIYGMNRGTVGFLLNEYNASDLLERIAAAQPEILHPLTMTAKTLDGKTTKALAFNEVSVLRSSRQSANLKIFVDDHVQLEKLVADGILVSSAAGSTAYNLSVHGPVVPIGSDLMALTAISPFRPRRWRGALLPHSAVVRIENIDPQKRPISAAADQTEVEDIVSIEVSQLVSKCVSMLFDEGHSLNERILREQFAV